MGAPTAELKAMAAWLKQCSIHTVAMQSTSVYWIAVYDILEQAGLEVYLVNSPALEVVHVQFKSPSNSADSSDEVFEEAGARSLSHRKTK